MGKLTVAPAPGQTNTTEPEPKRLESLWPEPALAINSFRRLRGECRAFNGLWIVNDYVHRLLETTHRRVIRRAICQVMTADASGFFLNRRITTSAARDSCLIDSVGFSCICFGERGYQAGGCSVGIQLPILGCHAGFSGRDPRTQVHNPAFSAHTPCLHRDTAQEVHLELKGSVYCALR